MSRGPGQVPAATGAEHDAYYGPAGEGGQGRRIAAGQSGMNQQVTAANWSRGMRQGMHPYWREEA
jgi:hypothetical protein